MKTRFIKIWQLALPYLQKGKRKDFILHTKGVIRAMELLLKQEKGKDEILIPVAILHDTGWSGVPFNLQKSNKRDEVKRGLLLHLKFSVPIINNILSKLKFKREQIKLITGIILSHKFKNPRQLDKRLLIDADTLADVFKEQFYSDSRAYGLIPRKLYNLRKGNEFYSKTAKDIFFKELKKRKKEIFGI